MLEETEKDIEKFKIIISEKDTQLHDLKNILQAAKTSYRKVAEENKQLKQHTTIIKQKQHQRQRQQQQQQQQQVYFSRPNKYEKVVYEETSDSDLEENQLETPIAQEEIEEQDNKFEQQKQERQQRQQQQPSQKVKIKIFDYLNSKDAKKNRH